MVKEDLYPVLEKCRDYYIWDHKMNEVMPGYDESTPLGDFISYSIDLLMEACLMSDMSEAMPFEALVGDTFWVYEIFKIVIDAAIKENYDGAWIYETFTNRIFDLLHEEAIYGDYENNIRIDAAQDADDYRDSNPEF